MVQATDRTSVRDAARANNHSFARSNQSRASSRPSFAEFLENKQSSDKVRNTIKPDVPIKVDSAAASNVQTNYDFQTSLLTLQTTAPGELAMETAAISPTSVPAAIPTSPSVGPTTVALSIGSKPSTAQFMAATGTDLKTASSLLYGVIGANQDLRDWGAIMSSPDPVAAARAATGQMYNSSQGYLSPSATRPQDRPDTTVLAQAGNFVYYKEKIPDLKIDNYVFALVDGNGYQLTSAANSSRVPELARNFGFETSVIKSMEQQLDAQGVDFRGGAWPNGFLA